MFNVKRLVQIMFVLLATLGGLLLGLGQYDWNPTIIAVVSAVSAFILNDIYGIIRFNKWVANITAILVTAYTLSGFFKAGSGQQLILIANLLVYLQAVLMFQLKTPRVCWQIMVLSLLQVVVAAAFNLDFQGGVFFVLYMMVAGITMMLLTHYSESWQIKRKNRNAKKRLTALNLQNDDLSGMAPIAVFDQQCQSRSVIRRMVRHVIWLGLIGLAFTSVLFLVIPRDQTAWFGPKIMKMSRTGMTKTVDLEQDSLIALSSKTVMRVWFSDPKTKIPVLPDNEPYFRGMALGTLKIKNGHTTWAAPYSRVRNEEYSSLFRPSRRRKTMVQRIILEPTRDPLIYGVTPTRIFISSDDRETDRSSSEIQFCRPLSSFTRGKDAKLIEVSSFPYKLTVEVNGTGASFRFLDSWEYLPDYGSSMKENRAEYQWLTEIDLARYPTLVAKANEIVNNSQTDNHLRIARQLEQHFKSGQYSYTLDFRNIDRDPQLDAVEDFVRNFKRGHCEYYASALCLMLRSQGIPARVVVGFRGGREDTVGQYLFVQEQHAHAWVEAYIRPRDCTANMPQRFLRDRRSTGGSWLRLDPTPASSEDIEAITGAGGDPLGYAKNLWRDYVLGIKEDSRNDAGMESLGADPLAFLSKMTDNQWWQEQWQKSAMNDPKSPWWWLRFIIPVLVVAAVIFALSVRTMRVAKRRKSGETVPTNIFWKVLGSAISLVAPRLGRIVSGEIVTHKRVDFYERFLKILRSHGLRRDPAETQLEFASNIGEHFAQYPEREKIKTSLDHITSFFYRVRFGDTEMTRDQQVEIEKSIQQFEQAIRNKSNQEK